MTQMKHATLLLKLLFLTAGLGQVPALRGAEAPAASPIANGAIWKDGKPESLPKLQRPPVEAVVVFAPGEHLQRAALRDRRATEGNGGGV